MSKELPQGWCIVALGDIAAEIRNGLPDKPADQPPGLPILRISAVRPGRVNLADARFHRGGEREAETYFLRDGDLLVVRYNGNSDLTAACGMVRAVSSHCVYPDKLMRVRITSLIAMPAFVELAMRLPETRRQLDRVIKTAAGQHGISGKDLREIALALPPLPEQHRIVARIEALFARTRLARADLERIAPLSVKYRQSVLSAEYTGEHSSAEHRRNPVPLSECVSDFTYGTAMKCSHDVDGIPVLRIPNVAAGRVSLDDLKFADLPKREYQKLALEVGDLLIVRSNGSPELVGRPALIEEPAAGMAFAGYLIRARPCRERVNPAYLLHMLLSPAVREKVELNARSSSGVHNINATELATLEIPLPSLDEQQHAVCRIERGVGHALVWEAEATRALALLDRLEQSILARAFRGELVPQDPQDEPAGALLARLGNAPAAARRGRPRGRAAA